MGAVADNAESQVHFQAGVPLDFGLRIHWDAAGILTYQDSPREPIVALLNDLGPIAMADKAAEIQGGTAGDHLHTAIGTRPGPFFDYYRGIIDPLLRTAPQTARLKAVFVERLLGCLAHVL